jgi:hypothetical protein
MCDAKPKHEFGRPRRAGLSGAPARSTLLGFGALPKPKLFGSGVPTCLRLACLK